MDTVYLICAVVGGTLLVIQTVLLVFAGVDDATDADHLETHDGLDGEGILKLISLKTVIAFVTFFGLAGLASEQAGLARWPTLGIGLIAGALALYLVAWLMALLSQLHSAGNVDLNNAVGREGSVYLRIPAAATRPGKVTLELQ